MLVNKNVIESIRKNFLTIVQKNGDKFHPDGVERVKKNDWSIERFVLVSKTEDSALKALVKVMEWRKSFGVNDLNDEFFPRELYESGIYTTNFKDKEGRPIIWYRPLSHNVDKHTHKSDSTVLLKHYLVYLMEKLDKQTSHQGWAIVSDCTGTNLDNVDLELWNFTKVLLEECYPRGYKYCAVVEMPWLIDGSVKLCMSWMNGESLNSIKFIKKEELSQYMDPQYIPVHLNGSYDKGFVVIPKGVKPLEQFTHIKFSADQINYIRSAFKAVK